MSLGVYLDRSCPHCGARFDVEVTDGITYNLMPMFREAGWDHTLYDGWTGAMMLPVAQAALDALKKDPERFQALNPSNGWGSYSDSIWFFSRLVGACEQNPDHIMRFNR